MKPQKTLKCAEFELLLLDHIILRAYEYVNRGIANFYLFSRVADVQEVKWAIG